MKDFIVGMKVKIFVFCYCSTNDCDVSGALLLWWDATNPSPRPFELQECYSTDRTVRSQVQKEMPTAGVQNTMKLKLSCITIITAFQSCLFTDTKKHIDTNLCPCIGGIEGVTYCFRLSYPNLPPSATPTNDNFESIQVNCPQLFARLPPI